MRHSRLLHCSNRRGGRLGVQAGTRSPTQDRGVDLPDIGVVLVEDSETGAQLSVDTSDRGFRRRFREAAQRREAELTQTFRRAGVPELPLSTEEDVVQSIVRFASLRSRMRLRTR